MKNALPGRWDDCAFKADQTATGLTSVTSSRLAFAMSFRSHPSTAHLAVQPGIRRGATQHISTHQESEWNLLPPIRPLPMVLIEQAESPARGQRYLLYPPMSGSNQPDCSRKPQIQAVPKWAYKRTHDIIDNKAHDPQMVPNTKNRISGRRARNGERGRGVKKEKRLGERATWPNNLFFPFAAPRQER